MKGLKLLSVRIEKTNYLCEYSTCGCYYELQCFMFVAAGLFVVVCVGCSYRGGERLVVRGGECVRLFCSNCQLKVSVYSSRPVRFTEKINRNTVLTDLLRKKNTVLDKKK